MRIIRSGFGDDERAQMKLDIALNIAISITSLIEQISFVLYNPESDEDKQLQIAVNRIMSTLDQHLNTTKHLFEPDPETVLSIADEITFVWNSGPIQEAYRNRDFQLIECARYFLNKVHVIMGPDYVLTNEDITQTYQKTEGIIEHEFEILGSGPAGGKIIIVRIYS
jgi:guanine nucleotide-binding protein G(s) subunit alpha